jgi:hypothetical protein
VNVHLLVHVPENMNSRVLNIAIDNASEQEFSAKRGRQVSSLTC